MSSEYGTTFILKELIWLSRQKRWMIPFLMKGLTAILLFIQKRRAGYLSSYYSIFSGIHSGSQYHSFSDDSGSQQLVLTNFHVL